jgi:nanoRNase/pAp phosphatase (c-di-AMP/oligoRNAs hydrolase)
VLVTSRYRLVTRSDFDGLVCAVLLKELDLIDDITFVHPKDMQDGVVPVTGRDITTNLPYVEGAHLVFDHHASETLRNDERENHVIDPDAPSAARVVYDFYGGKTAFPRVSEEMMAAVDQADSARFSLDEVLDPQRWVLLNFVMDARTGLGRFRNFRISNYDLMMQLIDYCRNHTIDEILQLPDVDERVRLYGEQEPLFRDQLARCTTVRDNLAVVDLRGEETIHAGNRFMVYALDPDVNISMHVMWGRQKQNVVFAVGKSIFNRSSRTDIGRLMLAHGGGGHANAGTCQVAHHEADRVQRALVAHITADG